MYLLAILLPPVAVLFCGKPIQALINIPLCLLFWLPAVVHAILIVNTRANERNVRRMVEGIGR